MSQNVSAWNAKIATVISYEGNPPYTLHGMNRVVVSSTADWAPINTIYRFNVGYIFRNHRFTFQLYILANSPDVPFIRHLCDQKQIFTLEVRSAAGYTDDQFGLVSEKYENCVLESEEVSFQVEGGPPVIRFNGKALRKSVLDKEGTTVYRVGSGKPDYGSLTDPFAWFNNGGG